MGLSKDTWWKRHHEELIEYAGNLELGDWVEIYAAAGVRRAETTVNDLEAPAEDDDIDAEGMAEAAMDSTGKHKAIELLEMWPLKALDEAIGLRHKRAAKHRRRGKR